MIHIVLRAALEGNILLPWWQHSKTLQQESQERWVTEGAQLALILPRTQLRLQMLGACGSEHHPLHAGEGRRTVEPATSQHLSGSQLQASPSSPCQFIPPVILSLTLCQGSPACKLWPKDNIRNTHYNMPRSLSARLSQQRAARQPPSLLPLMLCTWRTSSALPSSHADSPSNKQTKTTRTPPGTL